MGARLGIVATSLAVLAFAAYCLYPGWYSFDSASLLHQARTGIYSDLQPVGMSFVWAQLLRAGLPPGSLLVAHLAMFAAGTILLGLATHGPARFVYPLLLLWPPFLAAFGHLWVDIGMASALVLATGWIAWTRVTSRAVLSWAAVLPLLYAACMRHNAFFAVLPFFFLLVPSRDAFARGALAIVLAAAAWGTSVLLAMMLVERPVPAWSPTAIWDLSAVSIKANRILLPHGVAGPMLTLDELRTVVNPHEAVSILANTKSGIAAGIVEPYPPRVHDRLLGNWLTLPFLYPGEWAEHRFAVAESLFWLQPANKPESLFIAPGVVPFRDNPSIAGNETEANTLLVGAVRAMRTTFLAAPILYLALGLLAMLATARRAFAGDRGMVCALVASAWLGALPLVVLVPSAEWRYLLWPMLASCIALVMSLGSPQRFETPAPSRREFRANAHAAR